MQRVLLYHPFHPTTYDQPVSKLEKRVPKYLAAGWQLFPPPEIVWEESDLGSAMTLDEEE
jgi:hypothetical protein